METSNFRSELHVAQQSRRDKLRVLQHHSNPDQNVEIYSNHLDQFAGHEGLNPDLVQLRSFRYGNLSYEPTVFSSDMLHFAANSQALLAQKDADIVHQDSTATQPDKRIATGDPSFSNLSHTMQSNINSSAKTSGDPQNCSAWKSIGAQESCDWVSNYTSGSAGVDGNQNHVFVAEGLSGSLKANNSSASTVYMKPPNYGYQDLRSSLTGTSSEIPSHNSQKHYGDMHFYHNAFHEVTSATIGTHELGMASHAQQNARETARESWANSGNELVLLPAYADHSNPLRLNNACDALSRPVDGCHRWNSEIDYSENKASGRGLGTIANDNSNTQVLSLSLSSVPSSKQHVGQTAGRIVSEELASGGGCYNGMPDIKAIKPDYACFVVKPPYGAKVLENVDAVGNPAFAHRGAGPLGPFTGYATILKSSKYLRPAQQLLDEFCNILGPKSLNMLEASDKVSIKFTPSSDGVNAVESVAGAMGGDSGGSSSTFFSSNEKMRESGGLSSPTETHKPEFLQKKAKLLYMQEEICRRHKHYHQQMQMVVSSFETVAGLSAATPYLSLALKTVSRHFRCLRNAVTDQLKNVRKALGEDLSSLTTGTSSSKGDTSSSRQKVIEQNIQKQKAVGGNIGFFEPQQHVWRPQRGLPERAVAILRAWLFDHFLHPYPTDADKHMLATQTGLTRNQVSNWFINARVRVWKPMVEEIHTLETKGVVEAGPSVGKTEGKAATEVASQSNDSHSQALNRLSTSGLSDKQAECSEMVSSTFTGNRLNTDAWDQEKRSRLECRIPGNMDGSLVGFMPYQQSGGIDIGGLGAVSLTLGLRQNADGLQQQHPMQQQHENQLRRHFGDHIIYDFVG